MNVSIDFDRITALMAAAHRDGRSTLFEHEVYELLSLAGAETPPRRLLLEKDARHNDATLASVPGDRVVVKVVAPTIVHKHSVGGVRIIENRPERIRAATRRMLQEVPAAYAGWIEREPELAPPPYAALRGAGLVEAIARDLRGVLLCQYMPPDSLGLGSEMIVGVRRTREFGMILTAGLGGTEAELYAARFRKGQAALTASTELTGGDAFFELFTRTISYRKLAGLTRGGRRVVTDAQLLECFASFIALANRYSPLAPDAPFVLEELEVNPFGFTDYLMVPLDGHARFAAPAPAPLARPTAAIDRLLHPRTICIAGVSGSRTNAGRTMLRNILAEGFDPARLTILHPEARDIDSVRCVRSLDELPEKLDLCILAVGAAQVPDLSAEIIRRDAAAAVLLIPAGLGETADSTARAAELRAHIARARERGGGPVFLGGNSLGILSHPGGYDATFIPEAKLPANRGRHARHSAFLSQSGAYMITRMSKLSFMDPAYAVSVGNQIDLTVGDFADFFAASDTIQVLGVYLEGFADLDGLAFARAVRRAVLRGKTILCYKAGRTPEGKTATSGHTASLAGDYLVCESCLHEAGAVAADTFTEFEDLFRLAVKLHGTRVRGHRIAGISGAGFEAVGIADSLAGEGYHLALAALDDATHRRAAQILAAHGLDSLVTVKNPMDISPFANDAVHADIVQALLEDPKVDAVVAGVDPLSPVMHTLPGAAYPAHALEAADGIAQRLPALARRHDKPLVAVADGGALYDPLADALEAGGLPVFRSADRAVRSLGKYLDLRLRAQRIRGAAGV